VTEKGSGMNIHTRKLESDISESEVNQAISVLHKWMEQGGGLDRLNETSVPFEVAKFLPDYPELTDTYPNYFKIDG
jgi:hypothetical protein